VPFARRLMMSAARDAMREVLRRREAGKDVPDREVIPPWVTADHDVTTQVDVTGFLDERDAALRAHRTQIDPDGMFFDAPHDLQRRAWPWEDFALIDSRVPSELPEHDLFAGLR
ncbi:MAG TPA: mycothiol conjugate amidase Mca, partial [Micrococcus luteus]|nr:mycothiol conjugate amidase Mca [Micrococcus luteus]